MFDFIAYIKRDEERRIHYSWCLYAIDFGVVVLSMDKIRSHCYAVLPSSLLDSVYLDTLPAERRRFWPPLLAR